MLFRTLSNHTLCTNLTDDFVKLSKLISSAICND